MTTPLARMLPPGLPRATRFAIVRAALLYALAATLWILLSDAAVALLVRDPASLRFVNPLKGILFIAFTALLLFVLLWRQAARLAAPAAPDDERPLTDAPGLRQLLAGLAALTLVFVLLAAGAMQLTWERQRAEATRQLQSIAHLKVTQLEDWLAERRRDTGLLQSSFLLREGVPRLRTNGDLALRQRLLARLDNFRTVMQHSDLAVCDADGEPLLQAGAQLHSGSPELRAAVRRALADGSIQMTDLYRMAEPAPAHSHLDFVAPLPTPDGQASQAVVVLRSVVGATLYPSLQAWPLPSDSAEALLVRRDGDQVLFLNELRHRRGTALTLRHPLASGLLAAAALLPGYRPGDLIEAPDYRGVATLGVALPIPGTTWWLVAKVDSSEVFAVARRDMLWILFVSLATWGVAMALAVLLFQRRQLRHAEWLQREQADKLHALRLLSAIADNSADAIYAKDTAGRYLLFNRAAGRYTGKGEAEVVGRNDTVLFPPAQAAMLQANDRRVMEEDRLISYEETLDTPLGTRTFLAIKGPLHDGAGRVNGMYGIARDISERVEVEAALRRSNEELQRFNRAMVGRELDMVRLKGEVNALAAALGRPPPYDLGAVEAGPGAPA